MHSVVTGSYCLVISLSFLSECEMLVTNMVKENNRNECVRNDDKLTNISVKQERMKMRINPIP